MIHYLLLATSPMGKDASHIQRDAFDRLLISLLIASMGTVVGSKDKGFAQRLAKKQIKGIFSVLV